MIFSRLVFVTKFLFEKVLLRFCANHKTEKKSIKKKKCSSSPVVSTQDVTNIVVLVNVVILLPDVVGHIVGS